MITRVRSRHVLNIVLSASKDLCLCKMWNFQKGKEMSSIKNYFTA